MLAADLLVTSSLLRSDPHPRTRTELDKSSERRAAWEPAKKEVRRNGTGAHEAKRWGALLSHVALGAAAAFRCIFPFRFFPLEATDASHARHCLVRRCCSRRTLSVGEKQVLPDPYRNTSNSAKGRR